MAKAVEKVEKEKTCATGATCECRKLPVGPGNAPWKNFEILASQGAFPAFWNTN